MEIWHGRSSRRDGDGDCVVMQMFRSEMWSSLKLQPSRCQSAWIIIRDTLSLSTFPHLQIMVHRLMGTRLHSVSWSTPRSPFKFPQQSSFYIRSLTDIVPSAAIYTYPRTSPYPSPPSPKSSSFPPQPERCLQSCCPRAEMLVPSSYL